jgi:hypothetical protein
MGTVLARSAVMGLAPELESRIFLIRGRRVMLDSDLASVYGTDTRSLNQQVRRNLDRFPEDFGFLLSKEEHQGLMSHSVISKRGGRRTRPWVFTEHGAVMLASVLRSPVAVRASLEVVRAFVRLRSIVGAHRDLARRLDDLERRYDRQFKSVFDAIRGLMEAEEDPPQERIGFRSKEPG